MAASSRRRIDVTRSRRRTARSISFLAGIAVRNCTTCASSSVSME
jgi:hypothetical protein